MKCQLRKVVVSPNRLVVVRLTFVLAFASLTTAALVDLVTFDVRAALVLTAGFLFAVLVLALVVPVVLAIRITIKEFRGTRKRVSHRTVPEINSGTGCFSLLKLWKIMFVDDYN